MAAPVLQVATLAGARIVKRAQPVGCEGRGRGRHPWPLEQAVAQVEGHPLLEAEVRRGLREGVGHVACAYGLGAAGILLEGPGRAEVFGPSGHRSDALPLLVGARDHVEMRVLQPGPRRLRCLLCEHEGRNGKGCHHGQQGEVDAFHGRVLMGGAADRTSRICLTGTRRRGCRDCRSPRRRCPRGRGPQRPARWSGSARSARRHPP